MLLLCTGVQSVGIEGESRDQLVVTGDGVDSVCLTNQIRKKFRSANIISVGEVKASDGEEKKETKTEEAPVTYYHDYYPPPYPTYYVCEPYPRSCFFFWVAYSRWWCLILSIKRWKNHLMKQMLYAFDKITNNIIHTCMHNFIYVHFSYLYNFTVWLPCLCTPVILYELPSH